MNNATNFGTLETTHPRTGKTTKLCTSHAHLNLPSQRALDPFQTNGQPCWLARDVLARSAAHNAEQQALDSESFRARWGCD